MLNYQRVHIMSRMYQQCLGIHGSRFLSIHRMPECIKTLVKTIFDTYCLSFGHTYIEIQHVWNKRA